MPIILICDGCGNETKRNFASDRRHLRRTIGGTTIHIEIMVAIGGTLNAGVLCGPCLTSVMEDGLPCKEDGELIPDGGGDVR